MNRHRVRQVLLGTLAGRAIVIGVATRIAVFLVGVAVGRVPGVLEIIDAVASVALALGAAYFAFTLVALAKRHLLWRVRRKLILSYVFVGFIPAALIVAFFLLSGFLLFYNLSSYLVQGHLRALADQAMFLAQSTALEIERASGTAGGDPGTASPGPPPRVLPRGGVEAPGPPPRVLPRGGVEALGTPGGRRTASAAIGRRQANAAGEFAGMSIAVVPMDRPCAAGSRAEPAAREPGGVTAGPWTHVEPPSRIPAWIDCRGYSGVEAYSDASHGHAVQLLVRAVAFPEVPRPGYAVVVDVPVGEAVKRQLRRDTGVEVKDVSAVLESDAARAVRPIPGRADGDPAERAVPARPATTSTTSTPGGLLGNLRSLLEYRDWNSGASGTLILSMQLSLGELYERISSAQGVVSSKFSQGLLLVLFIIGGLFIIIEALALGAGLTLAKSITGSVHELFTGTERVRHGDFTHKIAVKAQDQLGELAQSFNSMTASIEDLLREAAEKKRLEEELRIAREIQMSLLPQGPLAMPGISVTALCVPAREVGGDYYDVLPLDSHRVGVLIADVSGKGTSAALYMAELKGLMLSLTQIHSSPRALLKAANRIIADNLDARSFITMTYAVIDVRERTMTYARAGHTPLLYVPGLDGHAGPADGGRNARVLAPDGLVLGLKIDNGELFDRLLEEQTLALNAGDLYLFFTDGITEAMDAADDCFGEARLGRLLEAHAHLPPEELRERVLREIEAFVGDAPQHDDMTMILLKVDDRA